MPFVRRTLAIFRRAEFGFLGVVVETFTQTPRLKGPLVATGRFLSVLKVRAMAGDLVFFFWTLRGRFLSWLIVGIACMQILANVQANVFE
jgi:hypothetical protein